VFCFSGFFGLTHFRAAAHHFAIELSQSAISLPMAHDVFISHAHKDINIAKEICEKLESAQIKCWIAERDISVGEDWTAATRKAIASSRAMILLLSDNANAATHLEREIAHAFYTNRTILPVRLTETPPRRDFLFYLGNVSWFDASKPPKEQYLDALIASITGIVQNRTAVGNALPSRNASASSNTTGFSDSWLGGLQASHYGLVKIVKLVSIGVILFSVVWLAWYLYSEPKSEDLPAGNNQQATRAVPSASRESAPQPAGDASPSKPAYTYSRFGLWVAADSSPTPATPEKVRSAPSAAIAQRENPSSSPQPNIDHDAGGETEKSAIADSAAVKSAPEKTPETADQAAPTVKAADSSPTKKDQSAILESEPKALAEISVSPPATPLPTQSVPASAQSTPLVQATPLADSTSSGGSNPPIDSRPSLELSPAAKATPTAESTPGAEPTRAVESTLTAESTPSAGPGPAAESTPTAQSTAETESTASAESTPTAEPSAATESTPTAQLNASAEPTAAAESIASTAATPAVESTPAVKSMPNLESRPSDSLTKATPGVEPSDRPAEVGGGSKPASEEQSLKELVLVYMRTVASDDDSAQERFFAWRVNFFGKGLLSISRIRASMERYRQQWPVRDWEPQGEPEFPKDLHAIHPELYEVLQPFAWKVANGSQRKQGSALLYVRIRRDDQGQLHIVHLALRHRGENSSP
jgi:hypothetical protein